MVVKFGFPDTLFLTYGLFLMTVILFQGQHYWKLKLYRLTHKHFDQHKSIELFKKCRRLNILLIALIPIIFFVQLCLNQWAIKPENLLVWAVAANVFGVLEHINYYHRQLMIDNVADVQYLVRNRKLKIASLKKDIEQNEL